MWHGAKKWASFQKLISTLLNWPHCGWNIKWPAWLLMMTFMNWMLLYLIYWFSCPFNSSAVSCPPLMYCRSKPTGTQWGFNPREAVWHWSRLGVRAVRAVLPERVLFHTALPSIMSLYGEMALWHVFQLFSFLLKNK